MTPEQRTKAEEEISYFFPNGQYPSIDIFLKHIDFLVDAPDRYRRTAEYKGVSVQFCPPYVFTSGGIFQHYDQARDYVEKHLREIEAEVIQKNGLSLKPIREYEQY